MLKFNSSGFLFPDKQIASSIEELEQYFVKDIKSSRRKEIFDSYCNYSNDLKETCNLEVLVQWIDGSFTTKKENPNDIDLVTFLDYRIASSIQLKNFVYPKSLEIYKVDAYIVVTYPDEHKNSFLYMSDKFYWIDHFNKTRRNRKGYRHPKGFLELQY